MRTPLCRDVTMQVLNRQKAIISSGAISASENYWIILHLHVYDDNVKFRING